VARVAYGMAIGSEKVKAEIIDSQAFWKLSKKHKVGAIPKTLLNYGDSFIGVEEESSILDRVIRAQ
jgi:hypothetical protein